jgi:hypothetical protein
MIGALCTMTSTICRLRGVNTLAIQPIGRTFAAFSIHFRCWMLCPSIAGSERAS